MTDILLWTLIALVGADLLANLAVWRTGGYQENGCCGRCCGCPPEPSRPAPAHTAPADTDSEPERQSRRMDEGIDSLMTYQVKLGRGRVTGGEP